MSTRFEDSNRLKMQRLASLQNQTAELERRLSDARLSLERELAGFGGGGEDEPGQARDFRYRSPDSGDHEFVSDAMPGAYEPPGLSYDYGEADTGQAHPSEARTEVLVNHGRLSAHRPGLPYNRKIAIAVAAVAALIAIVVMAWPSGGTSWPTSVATVQREVAQACQNPNVKSEPGQVNFACDKSTRQVLWVFALITSADNASYLDGKTGRLGLEPITPAQGGEVAWSLNLHHPYSPVNPVDSIEVAARAINNIIGGATVTGADGKPVVQPGLESEPANCVRYTGSPAITMRKGFPSLCARPVTSPAGQAALVADVYRRWIAGAPANTAQEAAVLFTNARDPGDARVQAILKQLKM